MEQKVIETIMKYNLIQDGDKLVLAVSGGPDSIAMLHILYNIQTQFKQQNIKFSFVVAHINHMIRKDASIDEEYVKRICKKIDVDFYSKSIDVIQIAHNNKMGIEETGRYVRYEFFDEILRNTNSNKIAIAHNKNDKIETILMNMLRGSGISGLKGIEPVKDNKYIRPLLECTRMEIEQYCNNNNLEPRIDETNFDNTYTRNKIRNIVIPYVEKEFNPNIIDTLNRLSELVKEEEEYFLNYIPRIYSQLLVSECLEKSTCNKIKINEKQSQNQIGKPHIILNLKEFNKQEKVIKSRILIYTITKLLGEFKGIEKVHIEDLIKLCTNNIGNKYLTPNKKIKILVKSARIYFIDQR